MLFVNTFAEKHRNCNKLNYNIKKINFCHKFDFKCATKSSEAEAAATEEKYKKKNKF